MYQRVSIVEKLSWAILGSKLFYCSHGACTVPMSKHSKAIFILILEENHDHLKLQNRLIKPMFGFDMPWWYSCPVMVENFAVRPKYARRCHRSAASVALIKSCLIVSL